MELCQSKTFSVIIAFWNQIQKKEFQNFLPKVLKRVLFNEFLRMFNAFVST